MDCSKLITRNYSTSFSLGIRMFASKFRMPIYAIYGFVRFADEIVDTFHDYNKSLLLAKYYQDTFDAIENRVSFNPILNAFQEVVHAYQIDLDLIEAFLKSMEMDLYNTKYEMDEYNQYIYGSAEVVGLMCLRVFSEGNDNIYQELKDPARKLGSAFQKINFLRDIKSDFDIRERIYFPTIDFSKFTNADKIAIEEEINADFEAALPGIRKLPDGCRLGVYLAYVYYTSLFEKIKKAAPEQILKDRIRIPDSKKLYHLFSSTLKSSLGLI
jgi:15-cis-phytoene synthase